MEATSGKPYPSDVTDDEWAFVSAYLILMDEDAPQRRHDLREVFNERLPETGAALPVVACACLMLHRVMPFLTGSS